jgi:hypothetical protein
MSSKKRKKQSVKVREWGEWQHIPADNYYPIKVEGMSDEDHQQAVDFRKNSLRYENNIYQVNITEVKDGADNSWQWLSIKRRDRSVVRDWRELQRIKTELCGAEREAIEIYPPESQLIDSANQFHLWVMPEGMNAPVGFRYGRDVMTPSEATKVGAKQRAFAER